jgi:hypothetical protein
VSKYRDSIGIRIVKLKPASDDAENTGFCPLYFGFVTLMLVVDFYRPSDACEHGLLSPKMAPSRKP